MTFSLDAITAQLERHRQLETPAGGEAKTRAAVAMVLRQGKSGLELLFIQRALYDNDPWSGNIAFPGGKVQAGEGPRQAAERETAEEIGLDLSDARYLGQMPVVRGSHLPVQVSCFVYWLNGSRPQLELNGEVQDTYWADLDELDDPERRLIAPVRFSGEEFEVPAIRLPWPGSPVLWGLTYRLVMHFLEMHRDNGSGVLIPPENRSLERQQGCIFSEIG
jgi:8-oxo-dGTP pyrophosphatase MutT (NUDIX family)